MKNASFHLSLPCNSVTRTKEFYSDLLGAAIGRNTHQWIDVNFYGNQITFTKSGEFNFKFKNYKFEETVLPSFHLGIILNDKEWDSMLKKCQELELNQKEPTVYLDGKTGEHSSFFITDPNGYTIEFKLFKKSDAIFRAE